MDAVPIEIPGIVDLVTGVGVARGAAVESDGERRGAGRGASALASGRRLVPGEESHPVDGAPSDRRRTGRRSGRPES